MLTTYSTSKLLTFIVSYGNAEVAILSGLRYWLTVPCRGWLLTFSHSQFITNIVSRHPDWMNWRTAAIFVVRSRRMRQRRFVW